MKAMSSKLDSSLESEVWELVNDASSTAPNYYIYKLKIKYRMSLTPYNLRKITMKQGEDYNSCTDESQT